MLLSSVFILWGPRATYHRYHRVLLVFMLGLVVVCVCVLCVRGKEWGTGMGDRGDIAGVVHINGKAGD